MRIARMSPLRAFDVLAATTLPAAAIALLALRGIAPLRAPERPPGRRLRANLLLALGAAATQRLLVLPLAIAVARACRARRAGLLNALPLRGPARAALAIVLVDATMYAWHRANHAFRVLWRAHEVHHTDRDLDATTAIRFHPAELAASAPMRAAQVAIVGASPREIVAYELVMQLATFFHHSGVRLPEPLDRALRTVIVTPRMHDVHHGTRQDEASSNWSVVFSIWDRLFGTFRDPDAGRPAVIGSPGPTPRAPRRVLALLSLPFRGAPAS